MAPSPTKPVEPLVIFQEKAALLVVADDVGELEVDVEDVVDDDDDEVEEPVVVVLVGTGEKDKVGCPDATLQNCCPRVSIVDT